jgi:hypothetical protein
MRQRAVSFVYQWLITLPHILEVPGSKSGQASAILTWNVFKLNQFHFFPLPLEFAVHEQFYHSKLHNECS